MSHTTEGSKKSSKTKKMVKGVGKHVKKTMPGKRHRGELNSSGYKRTNSCNKEKSSITKYRRTNKKSDLNPYDRDKDNSDEDDHSEGEYDINFSDEDGGHRSENSSDESLQGGNSSDEESDDNSDGRDVSDEDSDDNSDGRDVSDEENSQDGSRDDVSNDEEFAHRVESQDGREENPSTDESHKSNKHGQFKNKKGKENRTKVVPTEDINDVDSDDGSSSDEENDSDPQSKDSITSKHQHHRGTTNPMPVLVDRPKIKIDFNPRDQPIGYNSVFLSTEMGNIARDMLPINSDDWRSKLLDEHKKMCWHTILVFFTALV